MLDIQRVAAAGDVVIMARIPGNKAVITGVVDAAERNGRAALVTFKGVIEDDIQNEFLTCVVYFLRHLAAFGARAVSWGGNEIVRQIRSGEFSVKGLPLCRFEGFNWMRGMMYFLTLTSMVLFVLAVLGVLGWGPLAGAQPALR